MSEFDKVHQKRISFILATKDHADLVSKILFEIREFITKDDELIIINGGETHLLEPILKEYEDIITQSISEPDMSSAHASNKGMLLARGKYIKQISDDDVVYGDVFEKAVCIMDSNPEIGLLVCGGEKVINGEVVFAYLPPGIKFGREPEDVVKYGAFGACGAGFFIRKSILSLVGFNDPFNFASDTEFTMRCIKKGIVTRFCRLKSYRHLISPQSTVASTLEQWNKSFLLSIKTHCSSRLYKISILLGGVRLLNLAVVISRLPEIIKRKGVRWFFCNAILQLFKGRKARQVAVYDDEFIWDGGLS